MSRSSFGTEVWSQESDTVQQNFEAFVQGWLEQMADDDKTVGGVVLQTNDPDSGKTQIPGSGIDHWLTWYLLVNSDVPSFPPTSLDRIMYPWIDPSSPGNATDNLDANALCYLMMTGNATVPSPAALSYSGA